jgi:DNA repair ATPase RecN
MQHSSKKYQLHKKTNISQVSPKCINHPNKASELFCFDHKCCLCSSCAIFEHRDHDCVGIQEATQRVKKEIDSFSIEDKINKIKDTINENCLIISKLEEKYEQDLKNLKNDFNKKFDEVEESNSKLKEKLNGLNEMKGSLNSSDLLILLDLKLKYSVSVNIFFFKYRLRNL